MEEDKSQAEPDAEPETSIVDVNEAMGVEWRRFVPYMEQMKENGHAIGSRVSDGGLPEEMDKALVRRQQHLHTAAKSVGVTIRTRIDKDRMSVYAWPVESSKPDTAETTKDATKGKGKSE